MKLTTTLIATGCRAAAFRLRGEDRPGERRRHRRKSITR